MKIAIPLNEKSLESEVCQSFGRAPYYLFYDTAEKKADFLDNAAAQSQGGAGIRAAQTIVDQQAEVLITPRCGENAQRILSASKIKLYKSIPGTAQANIDAFNAEELVLLDDFHPGLHQHGK